MTGPAPTELFLHGGGFVSGSIDETINDRLLTARAHSAGVQIISVDYRLAPEHPYPAAIADVIALLDELLREPALHQIDLDRVGIAGASAGGGIAAGAALALRDRGDSILSYQSLEVPALALQLFGASGREYAEGFGVEDYDEVRALYVAAGADDVYVEPLFAADLAGLPVTFIQVAEHDPLRDGGIIYAERLRAAGVATTLEIGHGHVHGSPGLTATFAAARDWQRRSAIAARHAYHPHFGRLARDEEDDDVVSHAP
jgi:acetyl esterase